MGQMLFSERDDLIRHIPRECTIEIREAADLYAGNRAGRGTTPRLTFCQSTLDRTLVTHYQEDALVVGDLRKPFANGVSCAEDIVVVIEEHHPDHRDAVRAGLKLRQDHLAKLVARGMT
jgi:hypothetical protein